MPMLSEQVIADNLALIARNRDLECELAKEKAKIGDARQDGRGGRRQG